MFKILKKYFYLFKDVKLSRLISKENLNKKATINRKKVDISLNTKENFVNTNIYI